MDGADISEIVAGKLYLGSKGPAADLAALRARGVTHVVNCTADDVDGAVPNHHAGSLEYWRLPLLDTPKCALLPHLQPALDWALGATAGGGVVFAHCHAGSSRSGAFVCAFLMASSQPPLSYVDAFALARSKRSVVKPNAGFKAHLRAFQGTLESSPPAQTPPESELAVDAQEFADRKQMERMSRGEEWADWGGYDDYKRAFEVALQRGDADWQMVEDRLLECEEGVPPPVVSGGSSSGGGGVGELVHTSSYRQRGESIDAYEERLYQMAAAAATPAVQEEDHHERGQEDTALALLAALPAPPGVSDPGGGEGSGGGGGGGTSQQIADEEELRARLEWLKQLELEDGAPLMHTLSRSSLSGVSFSEDSLSGDGDSGRKDDDGDDELERRFERLVSMQRSEGTVVQVPGPELEPEPEPE